MSDRSEIASAKTALLLSPRPGGRALGFTLIELMIVLAIMAALMAITVPSYRAMSAQNQRAACSANLKAIGQGLALFREDFQAFPPDGTEYLWTEAAVVLYRNAYGVDPPGDHGEATLIGAAHSQEGMPIPTSAQSGWTEIPTRGLGLLTLYYLGAYSAQLPPTSSEPRIVQKRRNELERSRHGLNGLSWFRGSGYITKLDTFHCPSSSAGLVEDHLVQRTKLPFLEGWGNYDVYYRRNFWNQGTRILPLRAYDESGNAVHENRHLLQPYPPWDTAVTWCPYHRRSDPPSGPGVESVPEPGDEDLVLYADGSVRRMVVQPANRMYMEPTGTGWPEVPIM
jgi:prepilin-type N-terminal cleavage/methylation domain-containing protein